MMKLYDDTCIQCSRLITIKYSTSFSLGIKALERKFRNPIFAIYGFVRFADEIVDTFHDHDKDTLLKRFRNDTYLAISEGISMNPVLHSFQQVVRDYGIENELIDAFLDSMAMDLHFSQYDDSLYSQYIYGSAEVVGLMCLRVFCNGNNAEYERLKPDARSLGSAFQKINFLRDMKSDFSDRGRVYFPGIDFTHFDNRHKQMIEADVKSDFDAAYRGILRLPKGARFGVYLAYVYYLNLFDKIAKANAQQVLNNRIRVSDRRKIFLLFTSAIRNSLNLL